MQKADMVEGLTQKTFINRPIFIFSGNYEIIVVTGWINERHLKKILSMPILVVVSSKKELPCLDMASAAAQEL